MVTSSPTVSGRSTFDSRLWLPSASAIGAVAGDDLPLDQIHPRRADEARDEEIARPVIEIQRCADLLDAAMVQHHDLGGERHGLDLVMGDIDHGGGELAVELGDLDAGIDPQRRVQIGQRLVEEEDAGLAHDGPADGDPLALAAGELAGLAVRAAASDAGSRRCGAPWHRPRPCARR